MKSYKKALLAAWGAGLTISLAVPVYAGEWQSEEGESLLWKYREEDGSYIRDAWREIDGKWYYFDGNGVMVTENCTINGKEESFNSDGSWIGTGSHVVVAGAASENRGPGMNRWELDENGWYTLNPDKSRLQNEWRKIGNKWYYFNDQGYMVSNDWIETDGRRYRVGEDGSMLVSQTIRVDGRDYELGEDGAWIAPPKTEEELQAENIAQSIVSGITSSQMGKPEKAAAIYNYVRSHMKYTYSGLRPDSGDAAGALYGFRRHTGNCFEYYAMSRYLLEAAGMPNIMVTRASDQDHFWNLVNVDGTWLHFDATPRTTGGTWCLVTTGQLRKTWEAHNFDVNAYPETP